MQRAQTKMAGIGEGDRGFHGFGVANLADQNYIGRLAQRVGERAFVGQRIKTDFALGDH